MTGKDESESVRTRCPTCGGAWPLERAGDGGLPRDLGRSSPEEASSPVASAPASAGPLAQTWEEDSEVTEEMIEAGIGELSHLDPEHGDSGEVIREIYLAMTKARREGQAST